MLIKIVLLAVIGTLKSFNGFVSTVPSPASFSSSVPTTTTAPTPTTSPDWSAKYYDWSAKYYELSAKYYELSTKYYELNETLFATMHKYDCKIKRNECRMTFMQSILFYEDKILKNSPENVRIQFPDMDEDFMLLLPHLQKNHVQHAYSFLLVHRLWYDPFKDRIVSIAEKTDNIDEKSLENRRVLLWIAFLQIVDQYNALNTVPTNYALRVWWYLLRRFYELRFDFIKMANLINLEMWAANEIIRNKNEVNLKLSRKELQNFKNCVVLVVETYSLPIFQKLSTLSYDLDNFTGGEAIIYPDEYKGLASDFDYIIEGVTAPIESSKKVDEQPPKGKEELST